MTLFHAGSCEPLKCGVHAALVTLAVLCCGYNAIAFGLRRSSHLGVNTIVYGLLTALELRQVAHHRKDPRC